MSDIQRSYTLDDGEIITAPRDCYIRVGASTANMTISVTVPNNAPYPVGDDDTGAAGTDGTTFFSIGTVNAGEMLITLYKVGAGTKIKADGVGGKAHIELLGGNR